MTPEAFEVDYEEHKLMTKDGCELNIWLMNPNPEDKNNITIVIAGSDAGNMGFSLPYAFHLLNAGYQVVTFDYRGFGESSEFDYNPNNVYHTEYITDFTTVMDWCKSELNYTKIGTMSFSMGTLISAVGYSTSSYDFYIGEGFILSPTINKSRVEVLKEKEMHLPKSVVNDEAQIQNLNIPTLLFASKSDEVTTLKDSHTFCKINELAKTMEYDGGHLEGAASLGFKEYIIEIHDFVKGISRDK